MNLTRRSFAVLGVIVFASALLHGSVPPSAIRVGSYNIRLSPGDRGTPNAWENRKADLVALIRKMNLDAFGLQEVCPDQMAYLRAQLPEFAFVGEHRESDRTSGEASPVVYRTSRFEAEKSGTFWLSETPDVPGRKGWGAACPRVCSYLVLRDKANGRRFCLANTHTDHVSAEAREKGMRLVIARMKAFGGGSPIVFTGDHNCCYDEPPAKAVRAILKDARDIAETPCRGPHNTFQGFGKYKDGPVNRQGVTTDYCIDYIYVSPGARVFDFVTHDDKRPGTDLYPSDHFPVTATIDLEPARPVQHAAVRDVRAYGAKGDGVTKDTAAVQAAIDAASAFGGGEVLLPPGRYLCGTLYLRSNVDVNLALGATIVGSRDSADYNAWNFCPQNGKSTVENTSGGHLIVCLEQTNVVLRGAGTIDGNGRHFMTDGFDSKRIGKTGTNGLGGKNAQDAILWRPAQMLWFCESSHVRLEGLHILNAPYWSVFLWGCHDVEARGLVIRSSRHNPYTMNGDGLNIDCCRHVRVSDCDIETSDDSLCLRANGKKLLHAPPETAYVTVANCILSSYQEAFRIGVGDGSIHDCVFANCVIRDSQRGINFSSTWFPSRGCDFRNIHFVNLTSHTKSSFLRIHRLKGTEPDVEDIHFSNISGTQGEPSFIWSRRGKPFKHISLRDVFLNGGIEVVNVDGFSLEGGTLRELKLSQEEYERRCNEIETFKRMLY